MTDADDEYIGKLVWFPTGWNRGFVDSLLRDSSGNIIAVIVRLHDGNLISVDMQR